MLKIPQILYLHLTLYDIRKRFRNWQFETFICRSSCIFLPVGRFVRLYVTSGDVLHTFAIPSFGLKIDACPGCLSQDSLLIKRKGLFYGQCSEIRGINHAFMPIVVKTVNELNFLTLYVNLYK
jgi:heme/copper-type cytochrome/quinol oxidase subunit 2